MSETTRERPLAGTEQYMRALAAAVDMVETLGCYAVAEVEPASGMWTLRVHHADGRNVDAFAVAGMGGFGPNTAGARLIEHGWMIPSFAHFPRNRDGGWCEDAENPGRWTAPVLMSGNERKRRRQ